MWTLLGGWAGRGLRFILAVHFDVWSSQHCWPGRDWQFSLGKFGLHLNQNGEIWGEGFLLQKQEIIEIIPAVLALIKKGRFLWQRRGNVVSSVLFPSSLGHNSALKCKKKKGLFAFRNVLFLPNLGPIQNSSVQNSSSLIARVLQFPVSPKGWSLWWFFQDFYDYWSLIPFSGGSSLLCSLWWQWQCSVSSSGGAETGDSARGCHPSAGGVPKAGQNEGGWGKYGLELRFISFYSLQKNANSLAKNSYQEGEGKTHLFILILESTAWKCAICSLGAVSSKIDVTG